MLQSSVGITLGNGLELSIMENDELWIQTVNGGHFRVNLGPATSARFEALREYLARLSIHAIDKEGHGE